LSQPPRIVISGVGLHTGHGDTQATWAALGANRSAVTCDHPWNLQPAHASAAGFPAAPAPDPSPVEFLADRKAVKYMGPCTQMAVLAAGRALGDAGLLQPATSGAREAMGLFLATGPIAFDVEQALESFGDNATSDPLALWHEGLRRCHPLLPFKMLLNMPLGLVSIVFGIKGPNFILYPGAEQGACALAHALRGLRRGRFARALVGGSASTLALAPIMNLRRTGRLALSAGQALPFSPLHAGWAPADQAAFLVLETEAEASRRGQTPYATLDSARSSGEGAADSLWGAIEEAPNVLFQTGSLSAADVRADSERARGRWTTPPALASADGLLGVAPAASFLLTTALACLSLRHGRVPAALTQASAEREVDRVLVAFNDQRAAAVALLSTLTSEAAS
jgi:3-oxoacyl-(acyl-carrier-protein) synthase